MFGGPVPHLGRGADPGARDQDEKTDLSRSACPQRSRPGPLAPTPEPDRQVRTRQVGCESVEGLQAVRGLVFEGDVLPGNRRAPVEPKDRNAAGRQDAAQMPKEELILRRVAGGMERDDTATRGP